MTRTKKPVKLTILEVLEKRGLKNSTELAGIQKARKESDSGESTILPVEKTRSAVRVHSA